MWLSTVSVTYIGLIRMGDHVDPVSLRVKRTITALRFWKAAHTPASALVVRLLPRNPVLFSVGER
jgi:hypothetical protein